MEFEVRIYLLYLSVRAYIATYWIKLQTVFFKILSIASFGFISLPSASSPPTASDNSISPLWLTTILRNKGLLKGHPSIQVSKVEPEDLSGNRGLAGALSRLRVTYTSTSSDTTIPSELPKTIIYKRTPPSKTLANRINHIASGQVREALFYEFFSNWKDYYTNAATENSDDSTIVSSLPYIYYANTDRILGEFVVLMQDLTCKQEGQVQGEGVNNILGNQGGVWSGGVAPLLREADSIAALKLAMISAADLHSTYWRDSSLLISPQYNWIKGVNWYRGSGKASWLLSINAARNNWNKALEKMTYMASDKVWKGKEGVLWSEDMVRLMSSSFKNASWNLLQQHVKNKKIPYTLTHGDFHAANMLMVHGDKDRVVLVDWTEVAVWEPMTDIGQMMISDVPIELRRRIEKELVQETYYKRLIAKGVSKEDYPWEQCWQDYGRAASERWMWILAYMAGMGFIPRGPLQYFHDQLLAFMKDHLATPSLPEMLVLKPVVCLVK